MCGRYAATANPAELVVAYEVEQDRSAEPTRGLRTGAQPASTVLPDYNMAPTKRAPVVLTRALRSVEDAGPVRQLRLLTWGLVPSWAKDTSSAGRMINARSETVATRPSFARALRARRALVPATGWYEWQRSPVATDAKGKPLTQPFFIRRGDGLPLAFAGLYEFWRDPAVPDGDDPAAWLATFTILTTTAEAGLDRIHDRQPLVLDPDCWGRWLDPSLTDPADVADVLATRTHSGRFTAYPVGRAVGSTRANGPALIEPLPVTELHGVVDPASGEILGTA